MFIPSSDLKRYIKVVMGFLVILAIVTPFLNIFKYNFNFDDFNEKILEIRNDIEIQEIITTGRGMRQKYSDQALTRYKSVLEHQIENRLLNLIEVKDTQVYVNVEVFDDIEKETFGKPKKIDIILESQHKTDEKASKIKPIEIKVNSSTQAYDKTEIITSELAVKIKDILFKDYNVSQEMIYVEVRKDE